MISRMIMIRSQYTTILSDPILMVIIGEKNSSAPSISFLFVNQSTSYLSSTHLLKHNFTPVEAPKLRGEGGPDPSQLHPVI